MPPKRDRATHNEHVDDFESEVGSPEAAPSKRAKLYRAASEVNRGHKDEDAQMVEDEPPPEDEDDAAAEEASTQNATRELEEKHSQFVENTPADFGILTRVELENFMCHPKLRVDLGPLINFIIGHNGSGKSAILTAITLCLGGKTTSTNRGSNLKSFIKEGENYAKIRVHIKNEGDGYRQDVYGKKIIVERRFSKDGTSGYSIKDEDGKTISTKKEELDEICDYMGIQVDNPMNILTQDAARQFLNNSSETDKYKFFIRGVQLEQLGADYKLLMQSIERTEQTLSSKATQLEDLKKIYESARHKFELCRGQERIRNTIKLLYQQHAWVQVRDQEKKLEDIEDEIKTTESTITVIQQRIDETEQEYDKKNKVVDDVTKALAEANEKFKPLEEEQQQAKEKVENNRKEMTELMAEQRNLADQIRANERRQAEHKRKIDLERDRLAAIDGGINSRLLSEKAEKIRLREDTIRKSEELEAEVVRFKDNFSTAKKDCDDFQSRINRKQAEINAVREKLNQLRQGQRSYMNVFGPMMQNLLKAIDGETRWQDKPVGPIGKYIKLLRQDWSSILETVFGGVLRGFVVTNYRDKDLLMALMRKNNCEASVFVSNRNRLSLKTPDEHFTTILKVLEVSDELVLKQLILNQMVEQSVLIEDLQEANTVWAGVREGDGSNIKICYAMNKSRPGWGHRIGGKVGAMNVVPVKPYNGAPRMQTNLETHVKSAEDEQMRLQAELEQLRKEIQEKEQIVSELQRSRSSVDTRRRQLRELRQRYEDAIEHLTNQLEENVADSRLAEYEAQLQEDLEEYQHYQTQLRDLNNGKATYITQSEALKSQLEDVERRLAESREFVRRYDRELSEAQHARQQALIAKNHWHGKMEIEHAALAEIKERWTRQDRVVKSYIEQATIVGPRVVVNPKETGESLDKRLGKLTEELKASEKEIGGSAEEIGNALEKAMDNYDKAKADMKQMQHLLQVMRKSYKDRMYRWKMFRRYISARARAQFLWLMSQRAFRGRLRLDHEKHLLKLEVQPNQQDGDAGRGPKTLSGGEKSFSTICLLLSLWEAMGSPIRCLDEFDVFMDSVNRKISMTMMIKAARRSIGKQFILITPQDMSSVDTTKDVKVHRMRDPERGQTTLNVS